jgi:hypothetical protein
MGFQNLRSDLTFDPRVKVNPRFLGKTCITNALIALKFGVGKKLPKLKHPAKNQRTRSKIRRYRGCQSFLAQTPFVWPEFVHSLWANDASRWPILGFLRLK